MTQGLIGGARLVWRSLRLLPHLLLGLAMAALVGVDFGNRLDRPRLARWWHRHLLRILGLRIELRGQPLQGAHISVANHVSWLDIPLLGSLAPTRFIGKAEIRSWPVAGWLATASGTYYLRRGKGGARPLLDRLVPALQNGGTVTLFPEGTTTDGTQLLPFHARLFGAAIEARCPVQPVALQYAPDRDGRLIAPFIGDDDLLRHLLRVLRAPGLRVTVTYGDALSPAGDRDALAIQAQAAIAAQLAIEPSPTPRQARPVRPALAA